MTIFVNPIRKFQEKKAKTSLFGKLNTLRNTIAWVETHPDIIRLPEFFNVMEDFFRNKLSKSELAILDQRMRNVKNTTARDEYGWFRAKNGELADAHNTWVRPTGHFDELFHARSICDLVTNPGQAWDQHGCAKRDMTDREFYSNWSTGFMQDKLKAIISSIRELDKEFK